MKVYGQIIYESGSYSMPMADEYIQWDSIKDAKESLKACYGDMDVNTSVEGMGVTLMLIVGEPEEDDLYPCDFSAHYPDYVFTLGVRGGVRRE